MAEKKTAAEAKPAVKKAETSAQPRLKELYNKEYKAKLAKTSVLPKP